MSKLLSTQVKVYPTAYRGLDGSSKAFNPESRLNTEYNITKVIQNITDGRNFVIKWDDITKNIFFSIKGYYFEVFGIGGLLTGSALYTAIKVLPADASSDTSNTKYPSYTLVPFDTNPGEAESSFILDDGGTASNFLGLKFSDSPIDGGEGITSLQLLEKVNGEWEVPAKSLFITDTSRVEDKETGEPITKHFTSEEITTSVGNIDTLNITSGITGADFGNEVVIKRVNIKDKAVDTSKLDDDAVTTDKIKDYNITEPKMAPNSIISINITDGAVTSAKIKAGEVKTGNIADGAVTNVKLNTDAVTNTKIANNAITSTKIGAGEVKETNIESSAVSTEKIADNAVTTEKINNGAVTDGKLATDAVTEIKIKSEAVSSSKLSTDSVITAKIKDKNVTEDKLADGAVSAIKLATDAVETAKIVDDAVTTEKIADSAITDDKVKDIGEEYLGIDGAKIKDATISTAKIVNLAVNNSKIATGTIENAKLKKITEGYTGITGDRIKAGEITGGASGHLASSTITNSNIVDGTIKNAKLEKYSITVGEGRVDLGGTISKDTILGISGDGVIIRTGKNTYTHSLGANGTVLVTSGATVKWTDPSSTGSGEGIVAKSATKLLTKQKIWGNDFDGTQAISGSLSGVGNIERATTGGPYNIGSVTHSFTNIYAASFYATSDERKKKDIKDFEYKGSILDIPTKEYKYKETPEKTHIGFIAQDLQKHFPELVDVGEEGYLSINESKLVYLLIEEVKKLKEEVEKLKE